MKTFYEKIGEERLQRVIETFYNFVFASPVISPLFTKTDRATIQKKQIMFLTQFLGGPDLYSRQYGHPKMRMRHLAHPINEEAKNEWLSCMHRAISEVFDNDKELGEAFYTIFPPIANHMVNS